MESRCILSIVVLEMAQVLKRTSQSDPLQIATVSAGAGRGNVGITFCPGKKDDNAQTGAWDRDLGTDLDAIQAWGASAVVTLIEHHELHSLRVETVGDEVARRGMAWFHMPIPDVSTPDERFESDWSRRGAELVAMLDRGLNVLVHCKGGLGRAGTIGARLLVETGTPAEDAITRVRDERRNAIETLAQERYVRSLVAREA
jgi:ADP-ribosyl-[dinitrogen reductase] hydrolase